MAGALLALWSTPSFSVGVELAWNACYGQSGAATALTSNCDSNKGSQIMVASFRPPAGVLKLEGIEVFIDFRVAGSTLPCWWNLAYGQLRQPQLVPLHVSPTDVNGAPLIPCDNHYFLDAGAAGGGGMIFTGANGGQLKGIGAIAAGTGLPVQADAQQYGIGFRIMNGGTTDGTCAGCLPHACFYLNTINLTALGVQSIVMQSPHPGSENLVTWQPGTPDLCYTSLQSRTWGQIKSIYR